MVRSRIERPKIVSPVANGSEIIAVSIGPLRRALPPAKVSEETAHVNLVSPGAQFVTSREST